MFEIVLRKVDEIAFEDLCVLLLASVFLRPCKGSPVRLAIYYHVIKLKVEFRWSNRRDDLHVEQTQTVGVVVEDGLTPRSDTRVSGPQRLRIVCRGLNLGPVVTDIPLDIRQGITVCWSALGYSVAAWRGALLTSREPEGGS